MIRLGLAGVVDPRHRWFTAAAARRRAGVQLIGFCERDDAAREQAELTLGPAYASADALVHEQQPTHLAVSAARGGIALAARMVDLGVDVFLAPTADAATDELDDLDARAAAAGRTIEPVHSYRAHQASRLAKELLADGSLGRLETVSLSVGRDADSETIALAAVEALDLFGWITDRHPALVVSDHPDDPALAAEFGERLLAVEPETPDGSAFEVRRREDDGPTRVQVLGDGGAADWAVRTGVFTSVVGDGAPIKIMTESSADAFVGVGEWVLNHHLRAHHRERGPRDPWQASRLVAAHLAAGE